MDYVTNRRLEVAYHREGWLVGALTIGRTARLAAYWTALRAHREPTQEPAPMA
ncbi:hypothetical protein [Streptomyces kebangsaanensis]|uniref:hypothetical protein n=1 Tax=Streptomyces kebangsaanensis TaxID=864058 RepID=UPI001F2F0FAD|nr:hypothetical protein [Streptomyces kebangsaanensis]